jgi:hypothetical protein
MYQLRIRKPVQLDSQQQTAVDALRAAQDQLTPGDARFAGDLIKNFYSYGRLSERQMHWVETLTARVGAPRVAAQVTETLNFQAIQDLFDRAAQKLKRVKIKLQTPAGTPVHLARAGAASRYTGQVMITDGGPYGANRYFGRIDVNGDFYATGRAEQDVRDLVREFAADPAGTAGRYGRLTGGCSFCNHGLKDARSIQVGYGPVCAKNFGLAWGG